MFLSLWKILEVSEVHPLDPRPSMGPQGYERSSRGAPQGSPAAVAAQGPLLSSTPREAPTAVCSLTDADGDLEPPRRPGGLKRPSTGSIVSLRGPQGPRKVSQSKRRPLDCFWVFQEEAEDLTEVGRGLWSAAVLLGRFLLTQPDLFWGPLLGAPSSLSIVTGSNPREEKGPLRLPGGVSDTGPPGASKKPPRVFRVLELGSGVGFLGPLLRRVLRRLAPKRGPHESDEVSVEVYLTDLDSGALRLCDKTQQLDEILLGGNQLDDFIGSNLAGAPERALSAASDASETHMGSLEGPQWAPVSTRVRRLDWQQGGPWARDLAGASYPEPKGAPRAASAVTESQASEGPTGPPGGAVKDPYGWTEEEAEALRLEGAIDLILACDGKIRERGTTLKTSLGKADGKRGPLPRSDWASGPLGASSCL